MEYKYEKELKFIIYRIALELKAVYDIFSNPDFSKDLENDDMKILLARI